MKLSRIICALLLISIFGGSYWVFSYSPPARYLPTGFNDKFYAEGMTFQDYINDTKERILAARKKAGVTEENPKFEDAIVWGRLPFEREPQELTQDQQGKKHKYLNGVLLLHGLGESPYEMQNYADYFLNRGFVVRSILLPGHGTVPGDLANIHFSEWEKAVDFGIQSFEGQVDNLLLCGFSTGAALSAIKSLEQSRDNTQRISGIILSSGALAIKIPGAFLSPYAAQVSQHIPRLQLLRKEKDRGLYNYESFHINGGAQIYGLVSKFEKLFKKHEIKVPIFSVSSMQDTAVDVEKVRHLLYTIDNPKNLHLLFSSHPVDLSYAKSATQLINTGRIEFGGRTIGYSHGALHISPTNLYFGRFGSYRFCPHYAMDSEIRQRCEAGNPYITQTHPTCGRYFTKPNKQQACVKSMVYLGSPTRENLSTFSPLRQLTYNENFRYVRAYLDRFLFENGFLAPKKFQMHAFERLQKSNNANMDLRRLLVNVYKNGDLNSAIQELSLQYDLSVMDSVNIRTTQVKDLKAIGKIENIKTLIIGENDRAQLFPDTRLHYVGDNVLTPYKNLNAVIALKKLKIFKIFGAYIEDIEPLKKLTHLEQLALTSTNITFEQFKELQKALPNTDVLYRNEINSQQGHFGRLMKDNKSDLKQAFFELAKRTNLNAINTVIIAGNFIPIQVRNFDSLAQIKGVQKLKLESIQVDSIDVLDKLPGLKTLEVGFVDSPQGPTKSLIEKALSAHPNLTVDAEFNLGITMYRYFKATNTKQISFTNLAQFTDQQIGNKHIKTLNYPGKTIFMFMEKLQFQPMFSDENYAVFENVETINLFGYPQFDLMRFKDLKKVKYLAVHQSALTNLKGIEKWSGLETLAVKDSPVNNLQAATNLSGLTRIELINAPVSNISPLERSKELEHLSVINGGVVDLSPLRNMEKLRELQMKGNPIIDLSPLENLTFRFISMDHTKVTDIGALIYHGRNRALYFNNTPFAKEFSQLRQFVYYA